MIYREFMAVTRYELGNGHGLAAGKMRYPLHWHILGVVML
jgi:hypothetical protein